MKKKQTGRTSTARMKPSGQTQEQRIASMVIAGGMSNDEIWAAFESTDPEVIKDDDPRRIAGLVKEPFDKDKRARLGRQIRSVRGLSQKAEKDNQDLLEILGNTETRPANTVSYENIKRWSCGDEVMDYIYGHTHYVWLIPDTIKDKVNPETEKVWGYGDEIPKKLYKFLNPMTGLVEKDPVNSNLEEGLKFGDRTGYKEQGMPCSFVSCWGGEQGVGKSKLAIAIERATCLMHEGRAILHNYGESNLAQLRQWIGPKAPDNLIVGERKSLSQIMDDIYKWKPILFVQDSLQTILEAEASHRGLKETLAIFKQLCTEEKAGKPHIIVISQLNKQGDLKGSSVLGHIVDAVFKLQKSETRKSTFTFSSEKNRGAETPRSTQYQHVDNKETGIVCLGYGSKNKPLLNLVQKTAPSILEADIIDPTHDLTDVEVA